MKRVSMAVLAAAGLVAIATPAAAQTRLGRRSRLLCGVSSYRSSDLPVRRQQGVTRVSSQAPCEPRQRIARKPWPVSPIGSRPLVSRDKSCLTENQVVLNDVAVLTT